MTQSIHAGVLAFARNARNNWKSGITVALVSMPLSVSLAIAGGSTPTAGIITAVWAGLFASFFGGSNYNIVGPTGALSGILASYALTRGAGVLPTLAVVAGVFVLIAFALKLHRYLVFIPGSAIHGFTLGVAGIIGLNQLNFAFGLSGLPVHEKFIENIFESLRHIGDASLTAGAVFLLGLVLLFGLLKFFPKIPAVLAVTPPAILLGWLCSAKISPFSLQTLGDRFPEISPRIIQPVEWYADPSVLGIAAAVAVVAILETMISARIADTMTKTEHNKSREMLALGLANIASGLAGGIPATAALARTALNVKTGATHRVSATISSVCIIIISFVFLKYFAFMPLSMVAAILVFTAARMVGLQHFGRMLRLERMSFVLSLVVAGVTLYEDPIVGLLAGTAMTLVMFVEKLSRGQFELIINDRNKHIISHVTGEQIKNINAGGETLVYSVRGELAYINAQAHLERFKHQLAGYGTVVLRLRELFFVDLDGVDALADLIDFVKQNGKEIVISGANPLILSMLEGNAPFQELKKEGKIFDHTAQALEYLGFHVVNAHGKNSSSGLPALA
ncbi:MAG: SulP family inorganic anion transporter [Candidatus Wildermuthbacteria bacterium]|nr:SulP family inorganic anion transporter [Candidatus Wildermuthbacteria bacterium]